MSSQHTPPPDDHAAIPILMEPVPLETGTADVAGPAALPRAAQQSLFDDPAPQPATPATPPAARRRAAGPEHLRAAGHLLRARAPAIVDEIVAAHSARLTAELHDRLQQELESLLEELVAPREP